MAAWKQLGLVAAVVALAGCGTITRPVGGVDAQAAMAEAAAKANPFAGMSVQVQPNMLLCPCVSLVATKGKHKLTLAAEDTELKQLVLDGRMLVNDGKVVNPADTQDPWSMPRPLAQTPAQRTASVTKVVAKLADGLKGEGAVDQAVAALKAFVKANTPEQPAPGVL